MNSPSRTNHVHLNSSDSPPTSNQSHPKGFDPQESHILPSESPQIIQYSDDPIVVPQEDPTVVPPEDPIVVSQAELPIALKEFLAPEVVERREDHLENEFKRTGVKPFRRRRTILPIMLLLLIVAMLLAVGHHFFCTMVNNTEATEVRQRWVPVVETGLAILTLYFFSLATLKAYHQNFAVALMENPMQLRKADLALRLPGNPLAVLYWLGQGLHYLEIGLVALIYWYAKLVC